MRMWRELHLHMCWEANVGINKIIKTRNKSVTR